MNETQIRERLRDAIGEATYPPSLAGGAVARLKRPAPDRHPRAVGLVAAFIALAVIAALMGPRLLGWHSSIPAGPRAAPPPTQGLTSTDVFAWIPPGDFDAAGLSNVTALVTAFKLEAATDKGKVTLIGAYADPARTVLLFRTSPDFRIPMVQVSDDQGWINTSSNYGGGIIGEYFYSLNAGPRPGRDGLAHLTVTLPRILPAPLANGSSPAPVDATFSLALKVQPSVAIASVPRQFALGSWKVSIEAAEVTPSVIHIQAVIEGASPQDVGISTVSLVDANGLAVRQIAYGTSVTVPKQQLTATNYNNARVSGLWQRPTSAGTYQLRFAGAGGTRTVTFNIDAPDPNAALPRKGQGIGPKPTDFAAVPQSLNLQGFLTGTITSAYPNMCGAIAGPSGTNFAVGLYFQVDGVSYALSINSDPSVRQYSGPGKYSARASLRSDTSLLYTGIAQLTVKTDAHRLGPDSGSVESTLDWVGGASKQPQLSISGTWTCTPGAPFGPG